ncbi:uncharacterized protein LOC126802687 [Argentina anserina]|uniref:uncharacterized protein LOC126802687 n=1 Tax=Argentina anserina TaxID=57926 RepID=UPI0021767808|nr:uncharacterized protein LOC126802687 [Potentilla anserina]
MDRAFQGEVEELEDGVGGEGEGGGDERRCSSSMPHCGEKTDLDGYKTWTKVNDLVQQWITNSVSQDIAESLTYYSSAQEVWEDLHEQFSQGNASQIFEIQRDIACHKQGQQLISAYYTKLKGFWDELTSYSEVPHNSQGDQQRLMQFLMGLNDTYSAICSQILLMNPLAYSPTSLRCSTTHPAESSGSAVMAVRNSGRFINQEQDSVLKNDDKDQGEAALNASTVETLDIGFRLVLN